MCMCVSVCVRGGQLYSYIFPHKNIIFGSWIFALLDLKD